jgi:hypothetical protein
MEGFKFRRQQPIDSYIVDFVCFENRIIIEVDGGQHAANNKDRERDSCLQQFGFMVLRFWNNEVLQNTNGVLEIIREKCLSHPPLNPLPSREGKKSRASRQGRGRKAEPQSREAKESRTSRREKQSLSQGRRTLPV